MFTDYYGLSFNPFDKQCQKEKDCFLSNDFKQMSSASPMCGMSGALASLPHSPAWASPSACAVLPEA